MDSLSDYSYSVLQGPDSGMCNLARCLLCGLWTHNNQLHTVHYKYITGNSCQDWTAYSCSHMTYGYVAFYMTHDGTSRTNFLSKNPLVLGRELKGKRSSNVRELERELNKGPWWCMYFWGGVLGRGDFTFEMRECHIWCWSSLCDSGLSVKW